MSSVLGSRICTTSRSALRGHATIIQARGQATTTGSSSNLSPLRYHIFSEPLPYLTGLKLQHDIIDRRLKLKAKGEQTDDIVLLLGMTYTSLREEVERELIPEHTPTYTTGRRDNSPNPDTLHPEEKKVQHVGAEFHITKRGGQVTYHGPGQLVGYPILDLNRMDVSTRCYVDWLQGLLASWCKSQGLEVLAPHPDGHVGIFASPTEKVASIGIHLQHRITSHGFAMNLTQEPIPWFDLVTACGLTDVKATSIHDMLKCLAITNGTTPPSPSVREVAGELIPKFGEVYKREMRDLADGGESELKELVHQAEETAIAQNKSRGWPTEPDLSKRT